MTETINIQNDTSNATQQSIYPNSNGNPINIETSDDGGEVFLLVSPNKKKPVSVLKLARNGDLLVNTTRDILDKAGLVKRTRSCIDYISLLGFCLLSSACYALIQIILG